MAETNSPPRPRTGANTLYLLRWAWSVDPWRVVLQFVEQGVHYATWVFFAVQFLRSLLQAITAGAGATPVLLGIGATMVVLALLSALISWYRASYEPLSNLRFSSAVSQQLFAQAVRVDLDRYENEEFYNQFSLALQEAEARIPEFLKFLANSTATAVAAGVTVSVLVGIDPWLLACLVFPLVGNFVFGRWLNGVKYRRDLEAAPSRRRIAYVNRVFYLPEYAKEIRLSSVLNLLLEQLRSGYAGLFSLFDRYRARAIGANFLFASFTFLLAFQTSFLYGAWLALVKHSIDIGTFAVLASATVSASWMLMEFTNSVIALFRQSLSVENLRRFLETKPRIVDTEEAVPAPHAFESLEFHGVSFAYEGRPAVLHDLSFTLKAGEKIALVGHNGAGKTSLVKLMMRLYEPTEGTVLYNGRPFTDYQVASYRRLFATAFQDFRVFSLTVAENVLSRTPEGPEDEARVTEALGRAGVLERVLRLPQGIHTVLTREFAEDGALLSGGELQKIALARAFAVDAPVILLDEPSSALDPISEYKLFEAIREGWKDRAVVFISHRLSSATLADRIAVLEHGRIIEWGTHQELLDRGGAYAKMFALQAEHYLEDNYATLGEDS